MPETARKIEEQLGEIVKFTMEHLKEGGLDCGRPEIRTIGHPFAALAFVGSRLEAFSIESEHRYLMRLEFTPGKGESLDHAKALELQLTLALIGGNVPEIKLTRNTGDAFWCAAFSRMDQLHPGHPLLDIADERESCKLNGPGAGELLMKLGYLFERGRLPI